MKKLMTLTKLTAGILLFVTSFSCFSGQGDMSEVNNSLTDSRVPSQYLPAINSNVGESVGYIFIDKASVKLHPYNSNIRVFSKVINYGPALFIEQDGVNIPYQSVIIEEFVNCDKKEYAIGTVNTYENYFGGGSLRSSNNTPQRWKMSAKESKDRNLLTILCALPLNH